MRIAIPSIDNKGLESFVSEHFGRAPFYTFIDIKGKRITDVSVSRSPYLEHSPGDVPSFLRGNSVDIVIAMGMGWRAKEWFSRLGIKVLTGASGRIKEVVERFIAGELESLPYEPKERFHGQGRRHGCRRPSF